MQHHRLAIVLTVAALLPLLVTVGCKSDQPAAAGKEPIFGNGTIDNTRVLARVNGDAITETMVDLRFEELERKDQIRFEGQDGRRMLVRQMVDEALRAREAEAKELHRDPQVARVLIAQRRMAMDAALRAELTRGKEPDIDAVRSYYTANRDKYVRLGIMHASHVECSTRERAEQAYRQLTVENRPLAHVVADLSENRQTREMNGDLGRFNKGGFIPHVFNGKAFTERVWDFERGPNPPFEFEGRWHVVVVHERVYDRPQTLEEAYGQVVHEMLPSYHDGVVEQWLRDARAQADVQYFGEYRPGQGRTARELYERAFYVKDPLQKLDLLGMLVDDYPDSDLADNALFMAANVALDTWSDVRQAHFYLATLLERYPNTEFKDDATYILENMSKPGFLQPKSIDDLKLQR